MQTRGLLNAILGSLTTATTSLGANTLISYFAYRHQGLSDARLELTLSMQVYSEIILAVSVAIASFLGHVLSWRFVILLDLHRVLAVSFLSVVVLALVQLPGLFLGVQESDWTRLAYVVGLPLTALGVTFIGSRHIQHLFK